MCAAAQDKFWQIHDALFASQDKWAAHCQIPARPRTSRSIGRRRHDSASACVSAHKMRPLIEADREKASRAGVRATPSFFIDNQILEGVQPIEKLRKALDAALAHAGAK